MAGKGLLKALQLSSHALEQVEGRVSLPGVSLISLHDILELQDQPVSEEQAWALCYQLSVLLSDGGVYGPRKALRLRDTDGILLTGDGSVRLKVNEADNYFTLETEDQVVDYLGRLIYSCLDWGLGNNVERELNASLEGLVCQMTKVTLGQNMEDSFQPVRTLAEVIQICKDRLYDPDQAAHHYRKVCCTLFSETVELCRYLYTMQCARETLQKLVIEPETRGVSNWVFAWKTLVDELSRGVKLRHVEERLNMSAPLPAEHSPFQQLLEDIQHRRFKLRKVQTVDNRRKWMDPHGSLLEFVRSRPKLKPASDRKLKTRPTEEASVHELLMKEIQSVDQQKLLSSHKRRLACKDNPGSPTRCQKSAFADSSSEDASFLLNPILVPDLPEDDCEEDLHDEKLFRKNNITVLEQELFFPVLSSSPMDPHHGCSRMKQRSRSLTSNLKLQSVPGKVAVPLTIAEVIKVRQMETRAQKATSCDRYKNWRVCHCCSKRSVYFTWHNLCSLCNNVVCPECCIEMRIPFKWCINLPMSFFKKIVLNKDQGKSQFWRERWSWDSSRVPLVLESQVMASFPPTSLAMRDWHSQDVCTSCKGYLVDACDTVFRLCAKTGAQEC
nr:protein spire homolog 2-like isoform X1 [Paramormyrops kingsleyae]